MPFISLQAQKANHGIASGLMILNEKTEFTGFGENNGSDEGPYLSIYVDVPITEKLSIVPEASYANINGSGFGFLLAKAEYDIIPLIYLQGGPQISYLFESFSDINKAGIDLSLGAGVNVTKGLKIQARYAFEVTNRFSDSREGTSRLNWLHLGLGYTF